MLLAAACGSNGADEGSADSATTAADRAHASSIAAANPPSDEAGGECGDGVDGGNGAEGDDARRRIVCELGVSCVPAVPERVVALDAPVLGILGVYAVGDPFAGDLDPADVTGIEVVGGMQAPNLEVIAAAWRDVIIGLVPIVEPIREQFDAIAPTVAIRCSFYESAWLDDVALVVHAVGQSGRAEEKLVEVDAWIEEVRGHLAAVRKE